MSNDRDEKCTRAVVWRVKTMHLVVPMPRGEGAKLAAVVERCEPYVVWVAFVTGCRDVGLASLFHWAVFGSGHGGKRAVTIRLVDSWQSPRHTDIPIVALITFFYWWFFVDPPAWWLVLEHMTPDIWANFWINLYSWVVQVQWCVELMTRLMLTVPCCVTV